VRDKGIAVDETERLAALHRLGLLDTASSPAFDGVTRLAAAALRVPIVLVSLVDQNRVWFKSRVGLALREIPRLGSLCAQTLRDPQPLCVRDASADPRFAEHPLVRGPARVRAYLGIPLKTQDHQAVATLCAMDTEAREFGEVERVVLGEFAKIAEELVATHEGVAKSDGVLQYAMEREKLFRDTFEQAAVGILHTSVHGTILKANQRACSLLGYPLAELRELSFRHLTHPDDFPVNVREFKRALAGEIDGYRLEQRLRSKDQRYVWTAVSVTLRRTGSRQTDYSIVIVDDISAQKQAELDALRARDTAQDKAASQSRKLDETLEALQAQGVRALQAGDALRAAQDTLRATEGELHSTQQALLDTQALHREAQTSLQAAQAKLAAESATDGLTALPNRRSFSRRSEQAAQALRHAKKPYGLILLDLDNLKQVNDEYGHEVGDEVLRTLGNILNSQLRNSSDMAARLGGDEFAILCFGDINEQTLHDVAGRIHAQLAKEPLATSRGLLRFTGSFGLALSMADDPDWKTLYGRADAALREAKAAGKDRISFGRSTSKSATARLRALSVPTPPV
jgi:diguanylate cyclase (GGDEF)-like protein/PAS domain S-box-containing protein